MDRDSKVRERDTVNANDITAKIEELSGQTLDDEQRYEIELWQRGRTLGHCPPHVREEIQTMLEGYVRDYGDACIAQDGADREAVIAKHARANAAADLLSRFEREFEYALQVAAKTPDTVKYGLRQSQVPPESL